MEKKEEEKKENDIAASDFRASAGRSFKVSIISGTISALFLASDANSSIAGAIGAVARASAIAGTAVEVGAGVAGAAMAMYVILPVACATGVHSMMQYFESESMVQFDHRAQRVDPSL